MKKLKITTKNNGEIEMEFGGDLDGACCGYEDAAIRKSLERLGVRLSIKRVFCNLSKPLQLEAKTNGECITNEQERSA